MRQNLQLALHFDLKRRFAALNATVLGVPASGTLSIATIPADGDTQVIGGVTFTYKTTPDDAVVDVQIGATKAETATNLAAVLGASSDAGVAVNFYKAVGEKVRATAREAGTDGNAFAWANSTGSKVTRDAATLTLGTDALGA